MKFTGIIAAATLFVSALAQSTNGSTDNSTTPLNVTSFVGTWHGGALSKCMYQTTKIMTELYNVTLSCPKAVIDVDSNGNVTYTPSIVLGWWDSKSNRKQNATLSLDAYLDLLNSTEDTATFNVSTTIPNMPSNPMGVSVLSMFNMMVDSNNGHNVKASSILNVQLASSAQNGTWDVALFNATQSQLISQTRNRTAVVDVDLSDFASLLLVKGANAFNDTGFNSTMSYLNLTSYVQLNDTCASNSSSSNSSSSS